MPYIYKITNKINEKIYIGKTEGTIENRWKQHCYDYNRPRKEKRPLYDAMNRYGIENFFIEKIEECSTDILSDRERYWIEYYGSFKDGYNATIGGDGKAYIDYSLVYAYWNEGKILKEIAEIMNINIDTVSAILDTYNITKEERRNRGSEKCRKPVKQILENGDFRIFPSIKAAYKYLGKNIVKTGGHIGEVCNGKRKTAYGYKWEWIDTGR